MNTNHRPRESAGECPDPVGCARGFHLTASTPTAVGELCECCHRMVHPSATWHRVPTSGRTSYWQYRAERGPLGATSRQDDGRWRALRYGPDPSRPHVGRRDIGTYPTWQQARRAVEGTIGKEPHW